MRLSRLHCLNCREETIHVGFECCRCHTMFVVAAMVPRLSDISGQSVTDERRKRGGRSSKLNPRRALSNA